MKVQHKERGAELVAALMWGPKTLRQLAEVVHIHVESSNVRAGLVAWMEAMRASGVVRIADYLPDGSKVYALQATPHALEDAPQPEWMRVRDAKNRARWARN